MRRWGLTPSGNLPPAAPSYRSDMSEALGLLKVLGVVVLCVAMLHLVGTKSIVDGRVLAAAERAAEAAAAHPGRAAAQASAEEAVARALFGVCSNQTVQLPRQWNNAEQVAAVVTCATSRATALYPAGP